MEKAQATTITVYAILVGGRPYTTAATSRSRALQLPVQPSVLVVMPMQPKPLVTAARILRSVSSTHVLDEDLSVIVEFLLKSNYLTLLQ